MYSIPYLLLALFSPYFLNNTLSGAFVVSIGFSLLEYLFSLFIPDPYIIGYGIYLNKIVKFIVSVLGVLGISFFVILINIFLLFAIDKDIKYRKIYFFLFSVLVILFILPVKENVPSQSNKKGLNIVIIQESIDFHKSNFLSELDKLIRDSESTKNFYPKLIMWPESSIPIRLMRYPHIRDIIAQLPKKMHSYLVFGTYGEDKNGNGKYNEAIVMDESGSVVMIYDKIKTIPFFEGPPYPRLLKRVWYPFKDRDFVPGKGYGIFTMEKVKYGVVICSEILYPDLFRYLKSKGVGIYMVLSNEMAVCKDLSKLLLKIAQFRAIEHNGYILRANSTGYSALISPSGRIEKVLPFGEYGILKGRVYFNNIYGQTLFSIFGVSLLLLAFFFSLFVFLVGLRKKRY